MNTLTSKIFTFLLVLGFCLNAYSQQENLIGLNVNSEIYPNHFRPSVGLNFEKQFTKHNGFETGLFYRTSTTRGTTTYIDATGFYNYSFAFSLRYLTVPVLYKYYSKILNLSVGPTANLYLGWKQKDNSSTVHIKNIEVDHKLNVGFLAKLSKVIPLNKLLILEPELRFGFVHTFDDVGLGIGIAGKYRF